MKSSYTKIIAGFVLIAGITVYWRCTDLLGLFNDDRRKKKLQAIAEPALNETFFVMSTMEQCHRAIQYREPSVAKCPTLHCRAKLTKRLIEHIDNAKHLLCICLYQISLDCMAEVLVRAQRRGLIVRLITDKTMIGSSNSQITKLERAGKLNAIEFRVIESRLI